jgi:hypothetical protein
MLSDVAADFFAELLPELEAKAPKRTIETCGQYLLGL